MAGSRFTGPLRNTQHRAGNPREWFNNLPLSSDPDYWFFMDDFMALDDTDVWIVVKDGSASVAVQAGAGGEVILSSQATTEDDGAMMQTAEFVTPTAGKKIWFEIKVKVSDADQNDSFFGLCITAITNPENVLTSADRIGFQINDGNASILCKTEDSGSETSTDSGVDAGDGTYVKLGLFIDGVSTVKFYINRALVATHTDDIVSDQDLALTIFGISGDATGTHTRIVDYVMAVGER